MSPTLSTYNGHKINQRQGQAWHLGMSEIYTTRFGSTCTCKKTSCLTYLEFFVCSLLLILPRMDCSVVLMFVMSLRQCISRSLRVCFVTPFELNITISQIQTSSNISLASRRHQELKS